MANSSIYAAFERMWQHVVAALGNKSDTTHDHDSKYDAYGAADTALTSANAYTDSEITEWVGDKTVSEQIGDAISEINHPVISVNGKTGAVELSAADIGAEAAGAAVNTLTDAQAYTDTKLISKADKTSLLVLEDTPLVENLAVAVDTPYTLSTAIELVDQDIWHCECFMIVDGVEYHDFGLGRVLKDSDENLYVSFLNDTIVLNNTTITNNGRAEVTITITKVLSYTKTPNYLIDQTEGTLGVSAGKYSHAEGYATTANGSCTHAEGQNTVALGHWSHAEGRENVVEGSYSHVEGYQNTITTEGKAAHVEGYKNTASNLYSHAEGHNTTASGKASHTEGYGTEASSQYSHAEGYKTAASGDHSHAEGRSTTASGNNSHAEGSSTTASGQCSHAEGSSTTASGLYSHAEGMNATASGQYSHAEGYNTIAASHYQHVQGRFNIEDSAKKYIHIVGNGDSNTTRTNAHTIDWSGNAWFAGDVYVKGTDQDTGSSKLATETYVDSEITEWIGDKTVSAQISEAVGAITHPVTSVNGKTGAVQLSASDVKALSEDTVIPSIAGLATENYVDLAVAAMVDSAPETLNTLNELAAALGDDPNFATTVSNEIGKRVEKVEGKGLSENDYTTAEKNKLANIEAGANKTVVDDALSASSTNPVQNNVVNAAISGLNTLVGDTKVSVQISDAIGKITHPVTSVNNKTGSVELSAADVGALPDTTIIPTKTSQLTNDSGYLTAVPSEYITETELAEKKYLTSYTETDPTVPSWAKAATKPSYTYSEVGADASGSAEGALTSAKAYTDSEIAEWVGDKTVSVQISDAVSKITHPVTSVNNKTGAVSLEASDVNAVPTTRKINGKALSSDVTLKISDLNNDSGFITGYIETDPTVPAWAKAATKPTYTHDEVGADAYGSAHDALESAKFYTDTEIAEWVGDKTVSEQISAAVVELDGEISEINTKLNNKSESGHKHSASDINSGTLPGDRLPIVPIEKGGTNADNVAGARTNLGVYSKSETDNKIASAVTVIDGGKW